VIAPAAQNGMEAVAERATHDVITKAKTSVTDRRMEFEQVMSTEQSRDAEATEAARKLVAFAFVRPMFEMMENDPLKSDLIDGGFGEEAFKDHLYAVLRDRMVQGQSINSDAVSAGSGGAFDELVGRVRDQIMQFGGKQQYGGRAVSSESTRVERVG